MKILDTIWTEFSWLLRHKGALMILVAAPVVYSLFYPLPYQLAVIREVPIIIWDNSNSEETRQWAEQLNASPKLNVVARMAGEPSESSWQTHPEDRHLFYFPANTKAHLAQQQQVTVAYGGKSDNFLVYSTALKAIGTILTDINREWSMQFLYLNDGNAVTPAQSAQVIKSEVIPLFNEQANYLQYIVPAVFVMVVQQVLMMGLGMQWAYRFEMKRPTGNAMAVWYSQLVIYTLHGLALILYFFKWALPNQGVFISASVLDITGIALPFVLGSIGLGMVLTFPMREQEAPLIWFLPLSVPLLFLTGISWPTFAMNPWLVTAAEWVPSTWGVNALIDAAFLGQTPTLKMGWIIALFWLSFSLCLRLTVPGDMPKATDPSTA